MPQKLLKFIRDWPNFQQLDANLVLYVNPMSDPKWASGAYSYTNEPDARNGFYSLQDDGNFVFYYPTKPGYFYAICATDTQGGAVSAHQGTLNTHPDYPNW